MRVESFIEHQDTCNAGRVRARPQTPRTTSNPDPSRGTNLTTPAPSTWPCLRIPTAPHNLELQLLPASEPDPSTHTPVSDVDANTTRLHLSIRPGDSRIPTGDPMEQLRVAIEEKAMADEDRRQAHMNVEQAELEFANAKRIRQQARAELDKAHVLRDEVAKQVNSILLHITCHDCRQKLRDDKVVGEGETKISDT